ncbi:hypothetical protein L202_01936 [Cryptococcus amylolentus CBS 6039]|uniref:Peroxisomal ATPase PEX6 n=1 Tax=Cryptococcus amylolentus CBS 6039 TaxID=1295533 RepID=A0A1E3HYV1_9TREE|nr:hypothetical protein L202_01936 [Cryptococcus amylolentus CBS 6039]ODN81514.1 hypothetical protein L202_01936 [Cryptococcus amylolentus CBS 6039]
MPGPRSNRPLHAQVEPLLIAQSPAGPFRHHIGQASLPLWKSLQSASPKSKRGDERVAVSIDWPQDRRLGKGKTRNLVVWVEGGNDADEKRTLLIHPSLLPPVCPSPLPVTLHIHQPVPLDLAILQPVYASPEDTPSTIPSEDDFSALYLEDPGYPIIRQNDIISLHTSKRRYRLLLLEPVQQGHITPKTNIIMSSTPFYDHPSFLHDDYEGEEGMSESSFNRTHISLANFDPDAFLSGSLSLSLPREDLPDGDSFPSSDTESEEDHLTISSTTSGSITPRPNYLNALTRQSTPPAPVDQVLGRQLDSLGGDDDEAEERGVRFDAVCAGGKGVEIGEGEGSGSGEDVCWLGVGGLGRAGIFEGDWVVVNPVGEGQGNSRLLKALAWERLDQVIPHDGLPANPILLPPLLYRSLLPPLPSSSSSSSASSSPSSTSKQLIVLPTPFAARTPTLPTAKSITIARIATAEGGDKRYERSWLDGQGGIFGIRANGRGWEGERKEEEGKKEEEKEEGRKVVRRGDILAVPGWIGKPLTEGERQSYPSSNPYQAHQKPRPSTLIYFIITSIAYDPLVPIEEDFRSSVVSKARAGELGCWAGGEGGEGRVVWSGLDRVRVGRRSRDRGWFGMPSRAPPFSKQAVAKLNDLLSSTIAHPALVYGIQLSILIKGARGAGKRSLIRHTADTLGFNIVDVECYDIVGDTPAVTAGTLQARLSKAQSCAPSILVLHHIEALASKSESPLGRPPAVVKVIQDLLADAKSPPGISSGEETWPVVVMATTSDPDNVPSVLLACFKQDLFLLSPSESERRDIIEFALRQYDVARDVDVKSLARQTAALNAGDIESLILSAWDYALKRASSTYSLPRALQAGVSLTAADITKAIDTARMAYSDSIGAPKIPDVSWSDVGGLADVKQDILDTIQLPLDRPDLFASGLKKRSGILLYGPPGTGKTLLAKAVATSCSLNFFSVKGPELLNMYIGESEANVRRVFERAREAKPCVIFMDELDSLAPKRGQQGDSGGVMDRIVSQLLAELDGMSGGKDGGEGVFVMGATNRPDLLDPALLRPGRFDKMLYLSMPTTHTAQADILKALTRKFRLDEGLDLKEVAEGCGLNYTGADLYALCADAMLNAMTRQATAIDTTIARLTSLAHSSPSFKTWPGSVLTPQYYLAKMAKEEEIQVAVKMEDFLEARGKLVGSVSEDELGHYERVRKEFQGYDIGAKNGGGEHDTVDVGRKGKGKGRAESIDEDRH